MHIAKSRLPLFATALFAFAANMAVADDSEIFLGSSNTGVAPNVLFILDTSGSMSTPVVDTQPYDATVTYPGACNSSKIYYVSGAATTPPVCSGGRAAASFNATLLHCAAGLPDLATGGTGGGFYQDNLVQYVQTSSRRGGTWAWSATLGGSSGSDVSCSTDYPATAPYPTTTSSASSTPQYTPTAASSYWASRVSVKTSYTLYSANYLNYWNDPARTTVLGTRISVVQQAATNLINSLTNVNVGLMRYSDNSGSGDTAAKGGMVTFPMSPVETNRAAITATINSYGANGWTPLSETLFEAYRYYSGGQVLFGNTSTINSGGTVFRSVPGSRVGGVASSNQYATPITSACQKNFVIFLTDGLPTQDNEADTLINSLPNAATLGGACDNTALAPYSTLPGGWGPSATAGQCLGKLAQFMNKADLNSSLADQQSVQTYFIGFGDDPNLAQAFTYLDAAATRGGGKAYTAGDLTSLQAVLSNIISEIRITSNSFSAPTVAVNAFNRTETLNDLYVAVFQPSASYHWPGNVKKYKFVNGAVVDANGNDAIDPATGFFKGNATVPATAAQSFWSAAPDGATVPVGGAASHIPDWDPSSTPTRTVYTYKGASNASPNGAALLPFIPANITLADLGAATTADRDEIVSFARGQDPLNPTASRLAMGDPLHSQPAVVIYGGTAASPDVNDAVVYAATNDGYLHAFDVTSGVELWSFIPQDQLTSLDDLLADSSSSSKHYGLDGTIRVLKYDENGDGIVAGNDRVLLYFGEGRGGSNYYAIDVTHKTNPLFVWTIGTAQLPALGQAWSTPVLTKVNVSGATQNSQKIAMVIGGGYDPLEENGIYNAADAVGNGLYIVDALYGSVLWSASAAGATLNLPRMDHAIPSDVAVIDMNGDGFADRLYVGDMAGQLWRFDIFNGNTVANLVTGGVIASLGAHDDSLVTAANTRRFYNAPDPAPIQKPGLRPYMSVAIGSGYRGHPLTTATQDRFYSVRDFNIFTALTQTQYNSLTIAHDVDMTDITLSVTPTIPPDSPGWKLLLNQPSGWLGEKVLAPSVTLNNEVLFTTYTPNAVATGDLCHIGVGGNRAYAVSVIDGRPIANLQGHNNTQISDRSSDLHQGGIAPGVSLIFPDASVNNGPGTQFCTDHPTAVGCTTDCTAHPNATECQCVANPNDAHCRPVGCLVGVESFGGCRPPGARVKTYWNENNAQ